MCALRPEDTVERCLTLITCEILQKNRELELRARADQKRTHQAVILGTALTSEATSTPTIFVDDYGCTSSNAHNDPSLSCPPGG